MCKYQIIFIISIIFLITGCNRSDEKRIEVDFAQRDNNHLSFLDHDEKTLSVAISAMLSPEETFVNYQKLLNYISKKLNVNIEFVQRQTYQEVNNLLESGDIDLAFICSGAYVNLNEKCDVEIIAVPQVNGKCLYQAYIITQKNNQVASFNDLKNKKFAFTDPLSNTGRLYGLKRLKDLGVEEHEFFSETLFSKSHDNSIMLVFKELVDAATVDGLIYDYYEKNYPDITKNIKIIEKSDYFGIPPFVARADKLDELQPLIDVLLEMHNDKEGSEILSGLMIEKFLPGDDNDYNSIRTNYRYISK